MHITDRLTLFDPADGLRIRQTNWDSYGVYWVQLPHVFLGRPVIKIGESHHLVRRGFDEVGGVLVGFHLTDTKAEAQELEAAYHHRYWFARIPRSECFDIHDQYLYLRKLDPHTFPTDPHALVAELRNLRSAT